jgi:hypothetical protein
MVDEVLQLLVPSLQWLGERLAPEARTTTDLSHLIRLCLDPEAFSKLVQLRSLHPRARAWLQEVRFLRNDWAHNGPLEIRTVIRRVDSARLIASECQRDEAARRIDDILRELCRRFATEPTVEPARTAEPYSEAIGTTQAQVDVVAEAPVFGEASDDGAIDDGPEVRPEWTYFHEHLSEDEKTQAFLSFLLSGWIDPVEFEDFTSIPAVDNRKFGGALWLVVAAELRETVLGFLQAFRGAAAAGNSPFPVEVAAFAWTPTGGKAVGRRPAIWVKTTPRRPD